MDELALLDLLECPLCLERLDVTAKVLPCQHTFCKPCLRRLAAAHSELRCPECRAIVPAGVEELPANLLLVRLLEGLHQGPGAGIRAGTGMYSAPLAKDQSVRRSRHAQYSQSPQRRQTQGHRNALDGVPWARALCNYRGNVPGELNIKSGDIIILRRKVDENWYHGEANGNSGLVPANVMQVVNQLPQPLPLCRALYDFDTKDMDQEDVQNCLNFFKGDIISVIRRVDENWVEGKLGEKVGIFPIQFTEPNSAAAKLLDKRKANGTTESGPQARSGSGSRLPVPSAPGAPNRSSHPQGPADISPIFLGSSTLAVVPRVGESRSEGNSSSLPQGSPVVPGERKPSADPASTTVAMALMNPQSHSATMESKQSSNQQVSISVCAALYPYTPCRSEELELRKGEMVGVYGKFKEGWLRALSLRTGKVGILPANYVTPVLRTSARFLDPKSSQSQKSSTEKRPVAAKPHAPVITNGTVRPAGQAHLVAVTASGSGMRVAQQEGVQGRSMKHRRPSVQGRLHSRNPAPGAAVVRPQQPLPSGGLAQMQGLTCMPAMQRGRHNHPENLSRPMCWVSETTLPSAGDSLVLDLRDNPAKELPDRQVTTGLQSILVKPDAHKNNTEKPMKTVRFLTQEAPANGQRMVAAPLGGPGSPSVQPVGLGLELWVSQTLGGSMPMDGNMATQKKILAMDPASVDGLPPCLKPAPCRYRVMVAYAAQTDSEMHLREGELVLVQRPRQDGRVLLTQEKSGKTGLFQSVVFEVLEKLS
ncbi:E3 ubiquitin-protein ligase SH3RF2 isoform X1 [Anguilla rostrata]|uniref:E3 ubiquitin-protein ligase SH3RF2 isoform X1 n=1 Tax=Anguilla rostrata TaxID=7938 RepID=UPI0030CA843E